MGLIGGPTYQPCNVVGSKEKCKIKVWAMTSLKTDDQN
jgi:hypothetical protein